VNYPRSLLPRRLLVHAITDAAISVSNAENANSELKFLVDGNQAGIHGLYA
jgi:hypothetical protein